MMTHARRLSAVITAAVASASLAGCSHPTLNPIDWYHQLEGGAIAEQRPPPPSVDAPYPNLGTVPARPEPIDPKARVAMSSGLVADRTNAQYAASLNPLAAPSATKLPAAPAPRPADDETSGATLPGAAGPTPPKVGPLGPPQPALPNVPQTAPRKAPTQGVQSAALAPPTAEAPSVPERNSAPARGSVDAPVGEGRPADPIASLPAVPDAPPPPPKFDGVPASTRPVPPPATPPPPPPPPVVVTPGAPVLVPFPMGSATLPVESLGALKILTRQRGAAEIAVIGYGDAVGSDANAQSAALPLALARARAVAANLLAAGVPASSIRVTAEGQGHGAAARIVN